MCEDRRGEAEAHLIGQAFTALKARAILLQIARTGVLVAEDSTVLEEAVERLRLISQLESWGQEGLGEGVRQAFSSLGRGLIVPAHECGWRRRGYELCDAFVAFQAFASHGWTFHADQALAGRLAAFCESWSDVASALQDQATDFDGDALAVA